MRAVTLAAVVAVALAVGASAAGAPTELSGRIVFVSDRAPDLGRTRFVAVAPTRELGAARSGAVLAPDGVTYAAPDGNTLLVGRLGREPQTVTTAEYPIVDVAWSPDGRRVAFTVADPSWCGPGDHLCAVYRLFAISVESRRVVEIAQRARFPVWSPNGRWIAYAGEWTTFDSSGRPYAARADGSRARRLANARGVRSIAWSPTSDRLAFATGDAVVVVRLAGGARRIGKGAAVAWAPSSALAFASDSTITIVRGTRARQVRAPSVNLFALAWSLRGELAHAGHAPGTYPAPVVVAITNGRRTRVVLATEMFQSVAFLGWRRTRFVVATTRDTASDTDVYSMRPDGTDVRALTTSGDYEFAPTSAPDGSLVAFAGLSRAAYPQSAVHVVGADGRGRRQLTKPPAGTDDLDPAWSAEGGTIVFVRSHAAEGLRQSDLFVVQPDGRGERQLTAFPGDVRGPTWSPDGSQIAFGRLAGSQGVLAVVNADGSGYRELTHAWGSPLPAWSPDGRRLAFVSPWSGALVVYGLATGIATEFPAQADTQSAPSWSPDGSHLVYLALDGELHLRELAGGRDTPLTIEAGTDRDPDWSHAVG